MALNLSLIKNRLNSLSNASQKTNYTWKPNPGKQVLRIVPYKFQPDNPFIELKFHYGINNKTYLSPDSFNRPDPIVEFSNRMKKTGNKEDWQVGRKMEPKMRTYVPVLVRGEEDQGVKFWGFGKNVYQELMGIITDEDYGDITDLVNGRDIVVEFRTAEESGKNFPETTIRPKPNSSPAIDPSKKDILTKQANILDLFQEPTYEELKAAMEAWLNPENAAETGTVVGITDDDGTASGPTDSSPIVSGTPVSTSTKTQKSPSAVAAKANTEDLTKAFDNLFNS